jgi:hypothetical protein
MFKAAHHHLKAAGMEMTNQIPLNHHIEDSNSCSGFKSLSIL